MLQLLCFQATNIVLSPGDRTLSVRLKHDTVLRTHYTEITLIRPANMKLAALLPTPPPAKQRSREFESSHTALTP